MFLTFDLDFRISFHRDSFPIRYKKNPLVEIMLGDFESFPSISEEVVGIDERCYSD